ncbi:MULTISPECIES: competence type IV pilus minor pilin ComGD [unclassified Listeria]|uniref:competence type IV pilus minor pilin ComGD n=1 Tax=unclassified Listeria TaxID=2642072 RepID=UPI0021018718|nr:MULTISPECIES: competence type IV pilus minor pilin ComGD [unclassified Listeria]
MKRNSFTLIEMLFVLLICSLTIQLTITPVHRLIDQIAEKEMLEQIKADIFLAQTIAITNGERTEIIFNPYQFQMVVGGQTRYTEKFPKSLKVVQLEKFQFLPDSGHINRFTTVHFKGLTRDYKWIFQIGKGRFRIEEA